jgi:hypothetical protein
MIISSMLVMTELVRLDIHTDMLCLHQRIFLKSALYKYCGRCGLGLFAPDREVWKAPVNMVMSLQFV